MKKKAILSSALSILLCLSLIAGSTFALFTSESKVNIAVKAGNVDVVATIDEESLKTYSMNVEQPFGTFENGGAAWFDANSVLQLSLLTPEDSVAFTIDMQNNSNVNVQYRVKMIATGSLSEALVVKASIEGTVYTITALENVTLWKNVKAGEAIDDIDVTVDFPDDGVNNNQYKNAEAEIAFVVEAVQGNADVADHAPVDTESLQAALINGGVITTDGTPLVLSDGVGILTNRQITLLDAVIDASAISTVAAIYGNGYGNLVMESGTSITASLGQYGVYMLFDGAQRLVMNTGSVINADGDGAACIRIDNPSDRFDLYLNDSNLLNPTNGALGIEKTCAGMLHIYVNTYADYITYKAITAETDNYTNTITWYVDGVEVDESTSVVVDDKTSFEDAVANAADGAVIALAAGTYKMPALNGKSMTLVGTEGTVIDRSTTTNLHNADVRFENLTLKGTSANYVGFYEAASEIYVDCVFEDQFWCYGDTVVFENCTFHQPDSDLYNVWTYGANDVTFRNCTFHSAGKSLLIYSEGGATALGEQTVVVEDCKFYASVSVEGKAAIEIDSSLEHANVYVTVNDSVAEGFAKGSMSGETLWNHKKGASAVIRIDGIFYVDSDAAIESAMKVNEENLEIVLKDDVSFNVSDAYIQLGGDRTKSITVKGSGEEVLMLSTTYWSRVSLFDENATLYLENIKVDSSQSTGTWNSYDITFHCNVVAEQVDFLKAVALSGKTAVLNNVTITEDHDYYALWICANVESVTLNHCDIQSAGRGIKIDEEYVASEDLHCTVLNVSNTSFATAKKAAIMVKSAEGAQISLHNVDISNCVADTENAVWVDSDASVFYAKVVVTGGTKMQEA